MGKERELEDRRGSSSRDSQRWLREFKLIRIDTLMMAAESTNVVTEK